MKKKELSEIIRHAGRLTLDVKRSEMQLVGMILGYRDRRTERFAQGEDVAAFRAFERQARKRLRILDSATALKELRALPGNRLEALKGRRKGQWSIRINLRWRICFIWNEEDAGPSEVEIVDYHDE